MEFDIDVSGKDLLNKDYTIVIADYNNLIRGYKFDEKTISSLIDNYNKGKYRYKKSKLSTSLLKIRIYCIIIYYLFRNIQNKINNKELILNICKDFQGHEKDITSNLLFLLRDKLKLRIMIRYVKLSQESNADKYAFIMRHDKKGLIEGYVNISLKDIEEFLK